jgi:ubiquinone/menaquinone biosynthesis C-methylase UbiE
MRICRAYEDKVLPRIMDRATGGRAFTKMRAVATADLRGEVLEIGFGSGLNLAHLPDTVTKVHAVDPSLKGRDIARPRIEARGLPVEWVGLDGASIDLPDASVDCVLSTLTLCTIPDVESALAEVRRLLRPGGTFSFFEHGASPRPRVRRWQERLNPVQRTLFGGCRLDRPVFDLVREAGLTLGDHADFRQRPSTALFHMYVGRATV